MPFHKASRCSSERTSVSAIRYASTPRLLVSSSPEVSSPSHNRAPRPMTPMVAAMMANMKIAPTCWLAMRMPSPKVGSPPRKRINAAPTKPLVIDPKGRQQATATVVEQLGPVTQRLHDATGETVDVSVLERGVARFVVHDQARIGIDPGDDLSEIGVRSHDDPLVADALGWDRFALLGHSMGAGIGSMLAAACPQRVERLLANLDQMADEQVDALLAQLLNGEESIGS